MDLILSINETRLFHKPLSKSTKYTVYASCASTTHPHNP